MYNEEKLEKEIGEIHDSLNKSMALLRGISNFAMYDSEAVTVEDMGLLAEMATKILQEEVYDRLDMLSETIKAA